MTDQGDRITETARNLDIHDSLLRRWIKDRSPDGKGNLPVPDNVQAELKLLSGYVKYEEVYLHAYESLTEAMDGLKKHFMFYNSKRKHQTLKAKPYEVYYADLPQFNITSEPLLYDAAHKIFSDKTQTGLTVSASLKKIPLT